jgi:hypothetical protein
MGFNIGDRVQAVGARWEPARIIRIDADQYEVQFLGWDSSYNLLIDNVFIRQPIHRNGEYNISILYNTFT